MKTIGNFLAAICAFFFVLSSVAAITFFNIEQKAFSSETYKAAFKEQGLYNAAPAIFTDMILSSMQDSGDAALLLSILDKGELELVISTLIPPDELETLIGEAFDSFFEYINGSADTITISLLPIKQHLVSEGGTQAFTQIMLAQPECTAEQALQIALGFLSTGDGLIFCRPPQEVLGLVTPIIETSLQSISSTIPDDVILTGNDQPGLSDFRTRLNKARTIMEITPIIPLFLLLGIVIFTVRSIDEWLKWWGIPFIVTGVISVFFALVGAPVVRFFLQTVLLQGNADMPVVFLNMMSSLAGSVVGLILMPVAIQGIVLALIGAGMLVTSWILNRRPQSSSVTMN